MKKIKNIYFIGIGGIGMSGIAEIMKNLGYKVTGSDQQKNSNVLRLKKLGVKIFIGHNSNNVENASLVVFSSAISKNNSGIKRAIKLNIPVISRSEMLKELMRVKSTITVAGSHGKTTTTCIAAHIFKENNLDPTYIIGGKVSSFESNANLGEGKHIFAEADESDGSFLLFNPDKAIITGIDNDHLETYQGNIENLKKS